jgi:hypothetical protein
MHFFDFIFPHYLGITKIHMKVMGQHLVINSRSAALCDTQTLDEDPGVSKYLSEYFYYVRALDRCYQYTSV